MPPKIKNGDEPVFSEALAALEDIVERFKTETVPLEEALVLFETGVSRVRLCRATLDQAQGRVEELVTSMSVATGDIVPFEDADD